MVMEARRLETDGDDAPGVGTSPWRTAPRESEFGARLLDALERFRAPLEPLRWAARSEIRAASRVDLIGLLKSRHEVIPIELETAIREQEPEALAFRLAGDPRLLRTVQLLAS